METYDLANLLCMFDESINKIIKHLESGNVQAALGRARETHKAVDKLLGHCVEGYHSRVEKKI